jgi:hypothetical protein
MREKIAPSVEYTSFVSLSLSEFFERSKIWLFPGTVWHLELRAFARDLVRQSYNLGPAYATVPS